MSDQRKAPIDLVPLRALVGAARVFAHGNTKKNRTPGDFIERELDGVFFASTMRHTMELQLLNGTVTKESMAGLDVDTKLPTIDHLICNLLIIRTMLIRDGLLAVDPGEGYRKPPPEAIAAFFKAAEGPLPNDTAPNCRCIAEFDEELARVFGDDVGPTVEPCTSLNPCASCRRNS